MDITTDYKNTFGKGWFPLLEQINSSLWELKSFYTPNIVRRHGMMAVEWTEPFEEGSIRKFIFECIAYKIERISARVCENCGQYGLRRTELPETKTLCTACYAPIFNDLVERNIITKATN